MTMTVRVTAVGTVNVPVTVSVIITAEIKHYSKKCKIYDL